MVKRCSIMVLYDLVTPMANPRFFYAFGLQLDWTLISYQTLIYKYTLELAIDLLPPLSFP